MSTQLSPTVRELTWQGAYATSIVTDVVDTSMYEQLFFQIVDAGTSSWTIQIQTNLFDATTAANFVAVTSTANLTAVGLYTPLAVGITIPRIRAKLTVYATGTPLVLIAGRYRPR